MLIASHARRALRARNTLTPRFTDFFTDFEKKKTDCFAVYKSLLKKRFSIKDLGSNETLGRIEADFRMYPTRRFDFGRG